MVDFDGGVTFLAVCVVRVTDVDVEEDKKQKAGWIKQEREQKQQKQTLQQESKQQEEQQ